MANSTTAAATSPPRWGWCQAIQYGRASEPAGDQQARRQEPQATVGAVRSGLYAEAGLPKRGYGRLGALAADATPLECGGLCPGQQVGAYRLGASDSPYAL